MNSPSEPFLKVSVLFLLIFFAFYSISHCPFLVSGSDEASSKIDEADNEIRQAFVAVLEAEEAGANVSGLMVKLEDAGTLLAEAKNAYLSGNATAAFAKAEDSVLKAENVKGEASGLKSSALADAQLAFRQTLLFSLVGAVAFLGVLGFVWIRFKRGYTRKLLKMKPEVTPNAA